MKHLKKLIGVIGFFALVSVGSCAVGDLFSPQEGMNLSIKTSTTAARSVDGHVSSRAVSHTGVSISSVSFRGSEISFYSLDAQTLVDGDIDAAAQQAKDTKVHMELPDSYRDVTFSTQGDSVLRADDIGNFKNLTYNVVNINIGRGDFYYETSDSAHAYPVSDGDGGTIDLLGIDYSLVSNIVLVDREFWEQLEGAGAGIMRYEDEDYGITDVPPYYVQGSGSFYAQGNNNLIRLMISEHEFDVYGCIVYPMDSPIDLTEYTVLQNGYHDIDPTEAQIDISINMTWDMPTSTDYKILFDDPNNSEFNDAVARCMAEQPYNQLSSEQKNSVDNWRPQMNRYINQGAPETVYDFEVGVTVADAAE
jgi:hypothetical protein